MMVKLGAAVAPEDPVFRCAHAAEAISTAAPTIPRTARRRMRILMGTYPSRGFVAVDRQRRLTEILDVHVTISATPIRCHTNPRHDTVFRRARPEIRPGTACAVGTTVRAVTTVCQPSGRESNHASTGSADELE